jgi:hypothetical protein
MRFAQVFPMASMVFTLTSTAFATTSFPPVIRTELGLDAAPSCGLCHASTSGGGEVTKAFGKATKAAGTVKFNDATLKAALTKLATDKTDSDGDGQGDIAELKAGTDPNVSNPGAVPTTTPPAAGSSSSSSGCTVAADANGRGTSGLGALVAIAGAAAIVVAAHRRRQR